MKFSVLMSIYDKELPSNLKLSLASILEEQTILPNDLVIVEDGPLKFELIEILDLYEKKFPFINRIRLKKNIGLGLALRKGLIHTKFDIVARMDSDDISLSNRFEKQLFFLEHNKEIDILGTSIEEFNNYPGDIGIIRKLPSNHKDIVKLMKYRNPINHMTVMFKKEVVLNAGNYPDQLFFEDYALWFNCYKNGAKFANLDEVLVNVRAGNSMISRRIGGDYFRLEKKFIKNLYNQGFLSKIEYVSLIILKFSLRHLPVFLLEKIYKIFLRKGK